ncbi:hypothetical protein [Pseudoxanthomonas mexicana]
MPGLGDLLLGPGASVNDRVLWACLSVIVGVAHDGHDGRLLDRLEVACRAFAVPVDMFDQLAARFDFHYYRPMDCYLSREDLADARRVDGLTLH